MSTETLDFDARDLASAGWGVVFPRREDSRLRNALRPLTQLRQSAAGDLYRDLEFSGETATDFLGQRNLSIASPIVPSIVPYYLLLVGTPAQIPFGFQQALSVRHAVGRLAFDDAEDYERYAKGVLDAEAGEGRRSKVLSIFSPSSKGDKGVDLLIPKLTMPVADKVSDLHGWSLEWAIGPAATKEELRRILAESSATIGLFIGHGFSDMQGPAGSILCSDLDVRTPQAPIAPEYYFSSEDIADSVDLCGQITVQVGCWSAGGINRVPIGLGRDSLVASRPRERYPSEPFVSEFPKKLLSRHRSLAFVGNLNTTWQSTFSRPNSLFGSDILSQVLTRIMMRDPVGLAVRAFQVAASSFSSFFALESIGGGAKANVMEWAALCHDYRKFIVLGDPWVRISSPGQRETASGSMGA